MIIEKEEIDFLQEVHAMELQNETYRKTIQSVLELLDSKNDTRAEIRSICLEVLNNKE
jgi:hypothetical protein